MTHQLQDASNSHASSSVTGVLAQLIETFGAADSDNPEQSMLDKVLEQHETSKLIEEELQKLQQDNQLKDTQL